MEIDGSGINKFIKLKTNAANAGFSGPLIWGPFYDQELIHYINHDNIQYRAEFNFKLENNIPHQDSTSFIDNPLNTDTLCILQITLSAQGSGFDLVSTNIISQLIVRRNDFPVINKFK